MATTEAMIARTTIGTLEACGSVGSDANGRDIKIEIEMEIEIETEAMAPSEAS